MERPVQLDVYFGDELVGVLHDASPPAFEYAASWLVRAEPMPLAAIPLAPGRSSAPAVQAFFENLLPEGELRTYIAEQKKASTLFSLLLEVAGDTAGGFIILPAGQRPQPPSYKPTTWAELRATLDAASAIDIKSEGARISLAGAQDKASIALFDDGVPQLPQGTSPSTHILKPDIKRLAKVWESAANEALTMLVAERCGLPTAQVFYEPTTRACIVKRFDRQPAAGGRLTRLVQYDLCQLSGTVSEKKYEKEGGPGIEACAALIRTYSTQPAVDLRHFLQWIFFNLYTGNNDSHAKNLSMYRMPGRGVLLTPFYDLMCTRIYPGLSQEFAFSIGGEVMPGQVTQAHVREMARVIQVKPSFVLQLAQELARKMPAAVDEAVQSLKPALPHSAALLVERVHDFVLTTTRKTAARLE
ncbi:MAG TPA: type II toxin-antitoxin system HipA family toxin [Rhizobacter sp.]|nr:type II toxin-antitoxin system HipA family toxin [Rhizobacter sp.]